jgi:hypothetical protein
VIIPFKVEVAPPSAKNLPPRALRVIALPEVTPPLTSASSVPPLKLSAPVPKLASLWTPGCQMCSSSPRSKLRQSDQQDILETFVDRDQLLKLTEPTLLPSGRRIQGLKLGHPRQLALMHALVPLTAGMLAPYRADSKLQEHKRTQLDRLYQKIAATSTTFLVL